MMDEDKKDLLEKEPRIIGEESSEKINFAKELGEKLSEKVAEPELELWEEPEEVLPQPMGIGAVLTGIFVAPSRVFESVRTKPHVLWPILIGAVVSLLGSLLMKNAYVDMMRGLLETQLAASAPGITPENIDKMAQQYYVSTLIITPIAVALTIAVKGMVAHAIAVLSCDGKGKMKQSISIVAISYLIVVLGLVIRAPLSALTGHIISFSAAAVLPWDKMSSPIYGLLAQFDIFSLWYLAVSAIGFRIVHKISMTKAYVVSFVPFSIIVLMQVAGVVISSFFGK